MKYFLILLFLGGSITIFAQTNIDGNWKGTRETPMVHLKLLTLLRRMVKHLLAC
jgi:hypothetical protein